MKREPLPIADGSYSDETRPFSAQDCVNYLPLNAEQRGTRSSEYMPDAPGLKEFSYVGSGPIRGSIIIGGKCFVVSGTGFFQVFPSGFALKLGTVAGSGRCSLTFNQITNGNQVVIGNGSSGYVYDTVTGVFVRITDDAFPGFLACDYIASQIVGVEPLGRYFLNSALEDATAYNSEDTYIGESNPDLMRGLLVSHNEVLIGSETTIERFQYTGILHDLFQNTGSPVEQGLASTFGWVNADNAVFLFGSDGKFYRLEGYTLIRVSNFPIEQAVAAFNPANCFAQVWADKGHLVIYWTFPDGYTFGYDVASGKWHRRISYGLDRWRLNTLFEWNGVWYGGDYQSGQLYSLDWDTMLEGADAHVRSRSTGVLHANQNLVTVESLELVLDTGGPVSEYVPGYTQTPWWVSQGNAGVHTPKVYRAPAALSSWTSAITKSTGVATAIRDMRFLGNAVVSQNLVGNAGSQYGVITALDPSGTVAEQVKTLAFTTGNVRQDCMNRTTGYSPQMLTIDGGITLSAFVPPNTATLSSGVLIDLVRTGSGRWLGIGTGATGKEFCWTDTVTPLATSWTNALRLPGVGGVDIGGFNTTMDASPTAVVCVDSATRKVYRSDNTGIAFALKQTLTAGHVPTYVKWLSGVKWLLSTFSTVDQTGSASITTARIWTSADDGITWALSTSSSLIVGGAANIVPMVNFSYGNGAVLCGSSPNGDGDPAPPRLFKSLNYGVTWSAVTLPSGFVTSFTIDNLIPLTTYVG